MDQQDRFSETGAAAVATPPRNDFTNGAVAKLEEGSPVFGPEAGVLTLFVNGRSVRVAADPATTLAEALRYALGLTGKDIG